MSLKTLIDGFRSGTYVAAPEGVCRRDCCPVDTLDLLLNLGVLRRVVCTGRFLYRPVLLTCVSASCEGTHLRGRTFLSATLFACLMPESYSSAALISSLGISFAAARAESDNKALRRNMMDDVRVLASNTGETRNQKGLRHFLYLNLTTWRCSIRYSVYVEPGRYPTTCPSRGRAPPRVSLHQARVQP
jgi:hypothetical protein